MINRLILFSLRNRLFVLLTAVMLCAYGFYSMRTIPVDVFPDLNRPVVTVFTEAHGLAPEEVEAQITIPLETAVNGATGVYRVRSSSALGVSIVWVEFEWGSDIFRGRQIISEKVQQVTPSLPADTRPILGPITSIMGEIMIIGMTTSNSKVDMAELRTLAEWTVRPRLLSVQGVSQVSVIGGDVRQHHVQVDPASLYAHNLTLTDVERAVADSNSNTTGGVMVENYREVLVRNIGKLQDNEDLKKVSVPTQRGHESLPLTLEDLATVEVGGPIGKRGDAGVSGRPAVVLSIQKQPNSDTVALTGTIERELSRIQANLPEGVKIHTEIFRQAKFITRSITNVEHALRDGAILVAVVLFLFLLNFRTTIITLTAIPLSIVITFIIFKLFGLSINTMTLGGLAIAIGELVDDAIVDVENVFRRLKENSVAAVPRPVLEVVYTASAEVRNSIVFATVIVILVFLPLFALAGVEGRIFSPLGFAYITSILASLVVAVTLTPVLCYYLLPKLKQVVSGRDNIAVRTVKAIHARALQISFRFRHLLLGGVAVLAFGAVFLFTEFGKEFLPQFNEGSLTISVLSPPGTSLDESNRIGAVIEKRLLEIPEISLTGRRTGRAEQDEHAEGVHSTEIDVELAENGRARDEVVGHVRAVVGDMPGIVLNIGQPISHRIDHVLSGVRSQVAFKLYGPELGRLRELADDIEAVMKDVPGIVDLQTEKQVLIPQLHIRINRERAALHGVATGEVAETIEAALSGKVATQLLDGQRRFDVVVRLSDSARADVESIRRLPLRTASGELIPLMLVADFEEAKGPNIVVRENASRRTTVSANVSGRDLVSTVAEAREEIARKVRLPEGYFLSVEGQFESQASASRLILLLGLLSLLGIFVVLTSHFRSVSLSLQIMLSIPFAFIGAVAAMALTGGVFSIASLVGLVTLTGIASRNGIMMIDHFLHLIREEGEKLSLEMIYRGAGERLVPVLMTALTAMLALVPILMSGDKPGREILHPVAVVIFGGLISGTLLNLLVTPVVFWLLSGKLEGAGEPKGV